MADRPKTFLDDGFSWRHPLVEPISDDGGFRHFDLTTVPREDGKVARSPLVRGEHLAVYVQTCLEGQGERALHAHSEEATWLVLEGEAVFYDADEQVVATVGAGEGISLDPGVEYWYECHGERTVMVRAAARAAVHAAAGA